MTSMKTMACATRAISSVVENWVSVASIAACTAQIFPDQVREAACGEAPVVAGGAFYEAVVSHYEFFLALVNDECVAVFLRVFCDVGGDALHDRWCPRTRPGRGRAAGGGWRLGGWLLVANSWRPVDCCSRMSRCCVRIPPRAFRERSTALAESRRKPWESSCESSLGWAPRRSPWTPPWLLVELFCNGSTISKYRLEFELSWEFRAELKVTDSKNGRAQSKSPTLRSLTERIAELKLCQRHFDHIESNNAELKVTDTSIKWFFRLMRCPKIPTKQLL